VRRIVFFLLILLAVACRKEKVQPSYAPGPEIIRLFMAQVVPAPDFNRLDWSNYGEIKKNGKLLAVKVPFAGTDTANYEFLLVDINDRGEPGRISKNAIHYKAVGNLSAFPTSVVNFDYQTGRLNEYRIINDKLASDNTTARSVAMMLPGTRLPMVTVKGNYTESPTGAILNGTSAYILSGLLGIEGAGSGREFFENAGANKAPLSVPPGTKVDYVDPLHVGKNSLNARNNGPQVITWETEDPKAKTPIELERYLKSFSLLPNEGAAYAVKVYVDIPVDNSPDVLLGSDNATGDFGPGHVFIKLTKFNGGQQVNQVIGFYPDQGWMSASMLAIPSKMVDDGNARGIQHQYNASLTIDNWTTAEFEKLLEQIRKNAAKDYELDEYNCAHFIAESINAVKPGTIDSDGVLVYDPTNSLFSNKYVSHSPNGVYKALRRAKLYGQKLAAKIEMDVNMRTLPSTGPAF
jgi:hypothetical protein